MRHVANVILNDRPHNRVRSGLIAIVNQPLGVRDQSYGSKRRSISLRTSPSSGEGCFVNVKLWLTKACAAVGQAARRIGYALHYCLGVDVVLNLSLQRGRVRVDEGVDDAFEDQCRVSSPGVKVWNY